MKITIEIPPQSIHVNKAGHTWTFTEEHLQKMAENGGLQYALHYGLKQSLNDATASVKGGTAEGAQEAKGLADKRFDAILNGEVGTRTRETNPVEKLMRDMAEDAIKKAIKAKGHKLGDFSKARFRELVRGYMDKHAEALEARAEEILGQAESAPEADLDI